jgi:hypothetical protein
MDLMVKEEEKMETWVLVRGKGNGSLGLRERKGMETWILVRGKRMDLLV